MSMYWAFKQKKCKQCIGFKFNSSTCPFRYSINVPKNTKFEVEIHKFDKFFRSNNSLKLRPALRQNIFVPAKRSKFAIFIEKENPHSFFSFFISSNFEFYLMLSSMWKSEKNLCGFSFSINMA